VYVHSGWWYLVKHILVLAVDPGHNSHPTDHLPGKGSYWSGRRHEMAYNGLLLLPDMVQRPTIQFVRERKPGKSVLLHSCTCSTLDTIAIPAIIFQVKGSLLVRKKLVHMLSCENTAAKRQAFATGVHSSRIDSC